jgi:beta-lactamase superfamily II metal-dependent hydrolase
MLAVEMLPAGHGDSLVVEYGPKSAPHQLLIDAGTYHAWDSVRAELLRRRRDRYEIFVVTHVDEDHIGGAIALLDDPDLKNRVDHVWFNGYIHLRVGGNVLGPVNGEQFTHRLVTGGFSWNHAFTPKLSRDVGGTIVVPTNGELPTIPLPGVVGACMVLLAPNGRALERMGDDKHWRRAVEKAGLVSGAGDSRHTRGPAPHSKQVAPLPNPLDQKAISELAAKKSSDGSPANATSIALILEFDGKRVLFAADAPASVLTSGLKRYAQRVGEQRPRIDLVKLSHHGSNANISMEMLSLIDCRRFLISTNGDIFGHPDDAAIAKIIQAQGAPVSFSCNYKTTRTESWADRGPGVGATFVFPESNQHTLRVDV